MKKLNIQSVASILSTLFLLSACDRMAVDSSKISLKLPKEISGKVGALSSVELRHIAVQVTAADMAEPQILILDANDNEPLPADITLEIPSGNNRLIQVLAAYGSENDSATLYYGDVTKSLTGGSSAAEVPMDNLSGAQAEEEGRIYGRFLTAENQGPSGELKMVYRPAGKPSILVDRTMILGGWFNATIFKNVAVDYILPDGSFLGQQWSLDTMPLSKHLMRVRIPAHKETYYNGMTAPQTWGDRGTDNELLGFFSANAALLTDKKVCAPAKTQKNNGDIFFGNKYLSQSYLDPLPIKAFFTGTTPQYNDTTATFSGGLDSSSCAPLALADEFKKYIFLDASQGGHTINESIEWNTGLLGGVAAPREFYPSINIFGRASYKIGMDTNGAYMDAHLLPGIKDTLTHYQIYKRTNSGGSYPDSCRPDSLNREGLVLYKTNTIPGNSGDYIRLTPGNLGITLDANSSYVACLSVNGVPFGGAIYLNTWSFNIASATSVQLAAPSAPSQVVVNTCRQYDVNLLNMGTGQVANTSNIAVTVSANDSVLYSDSSCSNTGASTLNVTIPAGSVTQAVYFKAPTATTFNLDITSATGALTLPPSMAVYVQDVPTYVNQLEILSDDSDHNYVSPEIRAYKNGCFPLKVQLLYNQIPFSSSGTVNLNFKSLDGTTTFTPPSGTRLVNNCTARTPLSSLTFSSSSSESFALEVGSTLPTNFKLLAEGFTYTAQANVNPGPLVHHLSLRLPGGSSTSPGIGTCQPVEFVAKDAADQEVMIPAGQILLFTADIIAGGSNPGALEFHSSGSCYSPVSNFSIASGASYATVYMKALQPFPADVTYSSQFTERGSNSGPDVLSKMTFTPYILPLAVTVPAPEITVGYSVNYTITGGVPPYSATVTSGSGNASTTYYAPYSVSVTASAAGPITVLVTDGSGMSTTLNLVGQP